MFYLKKKISFINLARGFPLNFQFSKQRSNLINLTAFKEGLNISENTDKVYNQQKQRSIDSSEMKAKQLSSLILNCSKESEIRRIVIKKLSKFK